MNNGTIDSIRPGERGELNVPRDGNVAQRQRENAAQATPVPGTHAQFRATESARTLAYRAGIPENFIPFIQRVFNLETEVFLLQADIRSLTARLTALENKL